MISLTWGKWSGFCDDTTTRRTCGNRAEVITRIQHLSHRRSSYCEINETWLPSNFWKKLIGKFKMVAGGLTLEIVEWCIYVSHKIHNRWYCCKYRSPDHSRCVTNAKPSLSISKDVLLRTLPHRESEHEVSWRQFPKFVIKGYDDIEWLGCCRMPTGYVYVADRLRMSTCYESDSEDPKLWSKAITTPNTILVSSYYRTLKGFLFFWVNNLLHGLKVLSCRSLHQRTVQY